MRMSLFFHETGKQVAVVSPFDVSFWLNLHYRMRFHAAKGYLLPRVSWFFALRFVAFYDPEYGCLQYKKRPFAPPFTAFRHVCGILFVHTMPAVGRNAVAASHL